MRIKHKAYVRALNDIRVRDGQALACGHQDTQGTIDHLDPVMLPCALFEGKFHPDHSLSNLRLICFKCNASKGGMLNFSGPRQARPKTSALEREREKKPTVWPYEREYSAEEGLKHEVMRARWDRWVEGFNKGSTNLVKLLVEKAPSACAALEPAMEGKLGSSITYRRYLDEDIAEGIFEKFRDDGRLWVRKV